MIPSDKKKWRRSLTMRLGIFATMAFGATLVANLVTSAEGTESTMLKVMAVADAPVMEVSALAATAGPDGRMRIMAVGDKNAELASFSLEPEAGISPAEIHSFRDPLLERLSLCQTGNSDVCRRHIRDLTSQWEAMATDGAGRVFVLQETTSSVIVLAPELDRVVAIMSFDFFEGQTGKNKRKAEKSLGEGLLLLKNGHIAVAKESHPAAIIEFAPVQAHAPTAPGSGALGISAASLLSPGEVFNLGTVPPGAVRRIAMRQVMTWSGVSGQSKCDISDLASDTAGRIYVLSQKCRKISIFTGLLLSDPLPAPETVRLLPAQIQRPEAIVIISPGRYLIGSDQKKARKSLFIVGDEPSAL